MITLKLQLCLPHKHQLSSEVEFAPLLQRAVVALLLEHRPVALRLVLDLAPHILQAGY